MKRSIVFVVAVLLLVTMCVALTGCKRITETEEQIVVGTVTDKTFRKAHTTFSHVLVGKTTTTIPHRHPAKYLVTITYQGLTETFNNITLYNSVEVGDSVEITLVSGYTADHELVKQNLQY